MDPDPRARELRHEVAEARQRLDESLGSLATAARPRLVAERAVASAEAHARAALASGTHKAQSWLSEELGGRRNGVLIGSDQRTSAPPPWMVGAGLALVVLLVWRRRRRQDRR